MSIDGGTFIVQEYRSTGGKFGENPDGVRFEWIAASSTGNADGGARAIPKKPWHQPGKQRVIRTDYPAANRPSAQVLGPTNEPMTFEGRWDDRYNFHGYAINERQSFEAMCRRGNPVRITFRQEVFDAIISGWDFEYHRDDYIRYSFTVENFGRPDSQEENTTTPTASAPASFDDTNFITQAILDTHKTAPASAFSGSSRVTVDGILKSMSASLNGLADTLDTRQGILQPVSAFQKTATMFRLVQGDAANVVTALVSARADTEIAFKSAKAVLDFECWSRGLRSQCAILKGQTGRAATAMDERGQPKGIGIYYPRKGESLYAISNQVYGTPHCARLIAQRNGLSSLRLDGTEKLIIPEQGVG